MKTDYSKPIMVRVFGNTPEGRAARVRFILARRAERYTYVEIAQSLGISKSRVQQIIAYALEKEL